MNNLFTDFVLEAVPSAMTGIEEGFRNCWAKMVKLPGVIRWSGVNSTLELLFDSTDVVQDLSDRMMALEFMNIWNDRQRGQAKDFSGAYAKVKIRKDDGFVVETFIRPLSVIKPAGSLHGGHVLFAYNDW
jgi:hypothetical protein